ncbi:MAG: AAA family ATPase [Proteobacteria bacterium]|nr:AAA family ATPase [Pseudomonadota bacterium]
MNEEKIVPIILAAPHKNLYEKLHPAFIVDSRYSIQTIIQNWSDFENNLVQYRPELVVVQADLAPTADALIGALARMVNWNGIAIIVLTPTHQNLAKTFEKISCVRGVYIDTLNNWGDLAQSGYFAVSTERAKGISKDALQSDLGSRAAAAVTGTRIISFVSSSGGTGRSTIAENIGYELANRLNVNSLLMSFDLPATASIRMGLHTSPNASEYFARPLDGFTSAIQKKEKLKVIFAPDDSVEYAKYGESDGEGSVNNLVKSVWNHQYAAVLLDLPNGEGSWMTQALIASNTVVIVTRCTLADALATSHLITLLLEKMRKDVRVPRDSIYMVVNQYNDRSGISPRDFHGELVTKNGWAPPVLDVIPYDENISMAQDERQMPTVKLESYNKHIRTIINGLYPALASTNETTTKKTGGLFGIFKG